MQYHRLLLSIDTLTKLQVKRALRLTNEGLVEEIGHDRIRVGDILRINEGDRIPADGIITQGSATLDESMLTGESTPVHKKVGDQVIGASILVDGSLAISVSAAGASSYLGHIIEMISKAQNDKPSIQRLADKVSGIFVPLVLTISLLTLLIGYGFFDMSFKQATLNAIAVLVISCPCAMGLATPTAVMVGVGRAAKNGILIKGGSTLEELANIKKIFLDKTGTLTTGDFKIGNYTDLGWSMEKALPYIYQLEIHSSHPIARSIVKELNKSKNGTSEIRLADIEEIKGKGMKGIDANGTVITFGVFHENENPSNGIILSHNGQPVGILSISDDLKENVKATIDYLHDEQIKPIILSGDHKEKVEQIASSIGVQYYHGELPPEEKLQFIEQASADTLTAMVGDGINDAPALAKATVGISLSSASQAAIQSAKVVLLDGRFSRLIKAISLSKQTVITIKQNLFWAFAYNVIAIPLAAMGYLNPMWGAIFMAFSDIIVIGNSIRLKSKKI